MYYYAIVIKLLATSALMLIVYFTTCTATRKIGMLQKFLAHSNRPGHEISVVIFVPRHNRALSNAKWGEGRSRCEKMAPSIKLCRCSSGTFAIIITGRGNESSVVTPWARLGEKVPRSASEESRRPSSGLDVVERSRSRETGRTRLSYPNRLRETSLSTGDSENRGWSRRGWSFARKMFFGGGGGGGSDDGDG